MVEKLGEQLKEDGNRKFQTGGSYSTVVSKDLPWGKGCYSLCVLMLLVQKVLMFHAELLTETEINS